MQASLLGVLAGIVVSSYWIIKLLPRQSRLHKMNHRRAKRFLKKLQRTERSPSEVFGLLRSVDFFVFEEVLLLCFKQHGFRIKRNHAYTGDGGIDGTFYDANGNKFLIQAKRYKNAINPKHVSDFGDVVEREGAAGGFFIHTGRTGKKSYQSLSTSIRIISGNKLMRILNLAGHQ